MGIEKSWQSAAVSHYFEKLYAIFSIAAPGSASSSHRDLRQLQALANQFAALGQVVSKNIIRHRVKSLAAGRWSAAMSVCPSRAIDHQTVALRGE